MSELVIGLEVGTHKICTVIGDVRENDNIFVKIDYKIIAIRRFFQP